MNQHQQAQLTDIKLPYSELQRQYDDAILIVDDIHTKKRKLEDLSKACDEGKFIIDGTTYELIIKLKDRLLEIERAEREIDRAEREIDRSIENGSYLSTLNTLWGHEEKQIPLPIDIASFIRTEYVKINADNRYQKTFEEAMNDANESADDSVRSTASTVSQGIDVDVFQVKKNFSCQSAHLLPYALLCALFWYVIVSFVLNTLTWGSMKSAKNQRNDSEEDDDDDSNSYLKNWDFLQKCLHGSKSSGKKIDNVGIKHFSTNRIILKEQGIYLDAKPCVLIIPVLTPAEVVTWNGRGYDAIVLAGDWKGMTADQVYVRIGATTRPSHDQQNVESWLHLANENECETARHLLEQMIFAVCDQCRETQPIASKFIEKYFKGKNDKKNFVEWNAAIKNILDNGVPVPTNNNFDHTMKVRKISFSSRTPKNKTTTSINKMNETNNTQSNGKPTLHPAPDPILLLAKAVSNFLKRHELPILPGCGNDDSTVFGESSDCASDDMSRRGRPNIVSKEDKPLVQEITITLNNTFDTLSDDDSLLDE
jgi:hypothetical protein